MVSNLPRKQISFLDNYGEPESTNLPVSSLRLNKKYEPTTSSTMRYDKVASRLAANEKMGIEISFFEALEMLEAALMDLEELAGGLGEEEGVKGGGKYLFFGIQFFRYTM